MPLKKKKIEVEDYEEDIEDLEEELVEQDSFPVPKNVRRPIKKKVEPVKKRFVPFDQPERIGIVDAETNEIVAEGQYAVLQALSKILESQERIENLLGDLAGD